MSKLIVSFDVEAVKSELRELVRKTIEETINAIPDEKADRLVGAGPYERTDERAAYRAGHYERGFTTTSGQVTLEMPKLKGMRFATAVIERYKRRETSVEEAIIEMYLAGVSTRRIEDVGEILWGAGVSAGTVSNLNDKAFKAVEEWRCRPLAREYPYVYVNGIYLKRSRGGSYENVAVMVAIGVNGDGYREVVGCAEGFTESKERWPISRRVRSRAGCAAFACPPATRPPAWSDRSPRCSPGPNTSAAPCTSTATRWPRSPNRSAPRSRPCSRPSTPWSRARPRPPRSCARASPRR